MARLHRRRLGVAAAAMGIGACGLLLNLVSADQDPGATGWTAAGQPGVTSPLADCRSDYSCARLTRQFPVLYLQCLSDQFVLIGLADSPQSRALLNTSDAGFAWSRSDDERADALPLEVLGDSGGIVGFTGQQQPLNELRIYLRLPARMVNGRSYELWSLHSEHGPTTFRYDVNQASPSIQVNQAGYLPGGSKYAYAGNWMGSGGPMPVTSERFTLIDVSSGKTSFEGKLEIVARADKWSGNDVYRADFSGFQVPGRYRLRIEGLGSSQAFSIARDVYDPVFRTVFRQFYHARNSTPIVAPWAHPGHERTGGIPSELAARIHPAVALSVFANGEIPGSDWNIAGGWFDAGDYGQYVVNASPVWYAFGAGLDLLPSEFKRDDLGIPESGNGIPDVIDELEWGMDWLLAMQDPRDGGVYSRLAPLLWDTGLPADVKEPRYLFEKTTHATASFAAATALHARILAPWKPERARTVLQASLKAWSFLQATQPWPAEGQVYHNPPGVHAGEYPDSSSADNRLWAAAELYRTTAEARFQASFRELAAGMQPDPTAGTSFRHQGLAAYWAMLRAMQERYPGKCRDKGDWCNDLAKVLIQAADWYLRKADENPFGAPLHQEAALLGWGSFAHSSRAVLPLLQAWWLTGAPRYRDRAAVMINPQLGANPQSLSYITGIGAQYPRHPLSKLSQYDSALEPLPGIPVNGPHFHLPESWDAMRAVNESWLPASASTGGSGFAYPPLRRYVDSELLPPMSEPTIAETALTAVAFGLLADERLLLALPHSNPGREDR